MKEGGGVVILGKLFTVLGWMALGWVMEIFGGGFGYI